MSDGDISEEADDRDMADWAACQLATARKNGTATHLVVRGIVLCAVGIHRGVR